MTLLDTKLDIPWQGYFAHTSYRVPDIKHIPHFVFHEHFIGNISIMLMESIHFTFLNFRYHVSFSYSDNPGGSRPWLMPTTWRLSCFQSRWRAAVRKCIYIYSNLPSACMSYYRSTGSSDESIYIYIGPNKTSTVDR